MKDVIISQDFFCGNVTMSLKPKNVFMNRIVKRIQWLTPTIVAHLNKVFIAQESWVRKKNTPPRMNRNFPWVHRPVQISNPRTLVRRGKVALCTTKALWLPFTLGTVAERQSCTCTAFRGAKGMSLLELISFAPDDKPDWNVNAAGPAAISLLSVRLECAVQRARQRQKEQKRESECETSGTKSLECGNKQ